MKKSDLLIGIILGVITALAGSHVFILLFVDSDLTVGLEKVRASENTGKIITLGAVLNLILFFSLLRFHKEMMARGVILATILLAIATLFV